MHPRKFENLWSQQQRWRSLSNAALDQLPRQPSQQPKTQSAYSARFIINHYSCPLCKGLNIFSERTSISMSGAFFGSPGKNSWFLERKLQNFDEVKKKIIKRYWRVGNNILLYIYTLK